MPELPEVETIRRGIAPQVSGRVLSDLILRRTDLRWPIPGEQLRREAVGHPIRGVERRGKYLLLPCGPGRLLLHLGMSGSLHLPEPDLPPGKHDHLDLVLDGGQRLLRLRDPRRFGALLWLTGAPEAHPLLARLGPEPLGEAFHGDHLHRLARGRRVALKNFLMDGRVVVGVGNIYAAEALFRAGLHPALVVGRLDAGQWHRLAAAVQEVLTAAIASGGTSLRDYVKSDGKPGYFKQALRVYGRVGQACGRCGTVIESLRLGQRASCFCPGCQGRG
ncbi:MAG: bifunctional DNA-formamidopyrimidine glycosylase/DNA-(apurinic or apyrimidinic site) lyase [Magnetococcales bacterium]|nr:bifunctional DNA-formamidopyrimidine glycosylase/DNA-(apurinic or apyrimidinic site) lyase [Magnetococcales bacterium]